MNVQKYSLLIIIFLFLVFRGAFDAMGKGNYGLGPFEIRDQFPVTMPYLSLAPESPKTVPEGFISFSYQITAANTFLNSEGRKKKVTRENVNRGLVPGDFFSMKSNTYISGLRTYIDVESYRHLFRLKYGFFDWLEFGIELPFVSYVGGSLDTTIESFHELIGISNEKSGGGFRSFSDRNRYDYYVLKGREFIIQSDDQFENVQSDFVYHVKWNFWEGNDTFPAITVKFAYKPAMQNRSKQQKLISSGYADSGTYLFFSKGFGDWITYLGWGNSLLDQSDQEFSKHLIHRFIALEYRLDQDSSITIQNVIQSSIFPTSGTLGSTTEESASAYLSRATDVLVIGYKELIGEIFWEFGFVEDYNQAGNAVDIAFFWEIGQLF